MTKDERIAELEAERDSLNDELDAFRKALPPSQLLEYRHYDNRWQQIVMKRDLAMHFGRELAEELTTAWVECIECDGEDGSCKVCNGHGWVRMLDKTPLLTLWEQRLDQMASTRQSEQ